MKIIEGLEQGSDEWKSWRKTKITATSAAILMGNNPWNKPIDLYNEIFGLIPPKESNAAMARGTALEPEARQAFIDKMGIDMIPIVCEHEEYPWMAASLDGWNEDNKAILECKAPNEKTHFMAIEGNIPEYYRDQIIHQLAVTGGKVCYYVSYRPEYKINLAIVEVYPNIGYMQTMIETEKQFYEECMLTMTPPKPDWKLNLKE